MTKEQLVASAKDLPLVSSEVVKEYGEKRDKMVGMINERMLRRSDIRELVGENNLGMMQDNHANHARFAESILGKPDPQALVDTCLWVFRAYRSHGFHSNYWSAQLNAWADIVKQTLSPSAAEAVSPLYHWFIIHIPDFTALSDVHLDTLNVSHGL